MRVTLRRANLDSRLNTGPLNQQQTLYPHNRPYPKSRLKVPPSQPGSHKQFTRHPRVRRAIHRVRSVLSTPIRAHPRLNVFSHNPNFQHHPNRINHLPPAPPKPPHTDSYINGDNTCHRSHHHHSQHSAKFRSAQFEPAPSNQNKATPKTINPRNSHLTPTAPPTTNPASVMMLKTMLQHRSYVSLTCSHPRPWR